MVSGAQVIVESVGFWRSTPVASRHKLVRVLALLAIFLLASIVISLWTGYQPITWASLRTDEMTRSIFFRLRLPRMMMAAIIGATLACVGAALQALFRNPLAEPLTLGVSGGGALGASLAIAFGWGARVAGMPVVFIAAFAGALASISIVYRLAKAGSMVVPGSLLLAGIVINLVANAGVLTMQYTVDQTRSLQILRWLVGALDVVGFSVIWQMLVFLIPGWVVLLFVSRDLNLLAVDEQSAASLGVNVPRVERTVYLVSSLLVGVTVAVGGSIGFVGLVVPHIARLLFGQDTRFALPSSLLIGASFLMLADALARSVMGAGELPVGAVTAMLGGPFFLWLMHRQQRFSVLQ
ncbi:MAG: iron ABC transporter permease [Acidobacteriaceae bacterium]|nr:iron ABC transporter permease [Acidobacteriaceae bacterium]